MRRIATLVTTISAVMLLSAAPALAKPDLLTEGRTALGEQAEAAHSLVEPSVPLLKLTAWCPVGPTAGAANTWGIPEACTDTPCELTGRSIPKLCRQP